MAFLSHKFYLAAHRIQSMLEKLRHTIGRIVYEDSTSSHEEVGEVSRNLIPTTDNEIKRPTVESMLGTGGRSMTKGFVNFADSKAVINLCLMFILTYVLLATVAFSFIFERWSIIDSAYYATVTFTTIGYGDVSPSTTPGKIFAILFVLVGVAIVGVALGIVGEMALVHQEQAISKLQARGKRRVITMIKGTSESMPSVSAGRGVGSPFVESSSATAMGDKHESKFLKGSLKIIEEDGWLLFIVLLLAIAIGYFENWSFIDSLYCKFPWLKLDLLTSSAPFPSSTGDAVMSECDLLIPHSLFQTILSQMP